MPGPWASLARTRCSDCGNVNIHWTTAIDLPWRLTGSVALPEDGSASPDLLAERKRLWDAIRWCGPDAEAWWCALCAGWGVFSDADRPL